MTQRGGFEPIDSFKSRSSRGLAPFLIQLDCYPLCCERVRIKKLHGIEMDHGPVGGIRFCCCVILFICIMQVTGFRYCMGSTGFSGLPQRMDLECATSR